MTHSAHRHTGSKHAAPGRLLLPAAGAGLLIACAGLVLRSRGPSGETVSHVVRSIREVALAGNDPDAPPGAGAIGPWHVSVERIDPMSGTFVNFNLTCGPVLLSAATARLRIDTDADTFTFDLEDVVFTRVPDDEGGEGRLMRLDRYTLGPAPYGVDIVPDTGAPMPDTVVRDESPLAHVEGF